MRVAAQTRCRSEAGKPMRLSDLKAGDTVFICSAAGPDGTRRLVAARAS
ncbi:MAG: hypothetical protein LC796_00205 [Acidobacteria bacterium]|nr:hypothetical protein [Acidobacteriota bacterium]